MNDTTAVYLDHAATTPLDGRVLDAMLPYLRDEYGNASSPHRLGRRARFAVEDARERIAAHIGAQPGEIVFTSGGTEANNLALWTLARNSGGRIATTEAEHESILEPLRSLTLNNFPTEIIKPTSIGVFPLDALDGRMDGVSAISVMHTNNETGALSPLPGLVTQCRKTGIRIHSDCVQALGWADLNVDRLGVDLMTISAHKVYGPKGIGALFVRADAIELAPFVRGGSQERRRRGGTENVSAIVGMATAVDLAVAERDTRQEHLGALKSRLLGNLTAVSTGEFVVNTPGESAPHILNVSFPPRDGVNLDGEMLLLNLDVAGIQVSSGSACTSGALEPSHVLLSMGVPESVAAATIRFSFGTRNTLEEMDLVADKLAEILRRMRSRNS